MTTAKRDYEHRLMQDNCKMTPKHRRDAIHRESKRGPTDFYKAEFSIHNIWAGESGECATLDDALRYVREHGGGKYVVRHYRTIFESKVVAEGQYKTKD